MSRRPASAPAADITEVAPDTGGLGGEAIDQFLLVEGSVRRDIIGKIGIDEAVEAFRHLLPANAIVSDEVHHAARGHAFSHIADIMNADIPGESLARKHMGEAAEGKMAFQDQDPLTFQLCKEATSRQPTYARPDDDGIVVL